MCACVCLDRERGGERELHTLVKGMGVSPPHQSLFTPLLTLWSARARACVCERGGGGRGGERELHTSACGVGWGALLHPTTRTSTVVHGGVRIRGRGVGGWGGVSNWHW